MVMTISLIYKKIKIRDLLYVWLVNYIGNLIGSLILVYLVVKSGIFSNEIFDNFIESTFSNKMNLDCLQLFIRAILCNILLCLGVWMCFRVNDDSAKIFVIFWPLSALISSSFDHIVSNMTLLAIPLFDIHIPTISWLGYFRNIFFVSSGNIICGAFIIGFIYSFISLTKKEKTYE